MAEVPGMGLNLSQVSTRRVDFATPVVEAALCPNEPRLQHGSSIAVRNERARREAA